MKGRVISGSGSGIPKDVKRNQHLFRTILFWVDEVLVPIDTLGIQLLKSSLQGFYFLDELVNVVVNKMAQIQT